MKNRRWPRAAIAMLLTLIMVFSTMAEALAAELELPETVVSGDRLTGENAPEGNAVYFGTTAMTVDEARMLYRVKLYRDGDVSTDASVTIRTYDVSAVYGEDYALVDADTVTGDETTMREISGLQTEAEDAELYSGTVSVQTDDEEGLLDGTADVEVTDLELSYDDSGLTEENGEAEETEASEDSDDSEVVLNGNLNDALTEALTSEYLASMPYSSEQTITFAAGETEQEILILLKNDDDSEGTEGFSLMMTDSEGVEPYTNTTLAVSIEDDEPVVNSVLSFGAAAYTAENGTVTVTVTRSGAEYSMASAVITGTDVTGETQTYGEIAFTPYSTEQELTLEVQRPTTLSLTDLKAADAGENMEAAVEVETEEVSAELSEEDSASLTETDEDGNISFHITINGQDYLVKYKTGEVAGVIMDESYSPAVEVGVYYFPTSTANGGMFQYDIYEGNSPGWKGFRHSYVTTGDDNRPVAQLEYYSPWMWRTGQAVTRTTLDTSKISAGLFRYILPDWSQDRTVYGGQSSSFEVSNANQNVWESVIKRVYRSSSFSQTADFEHGVEIKDQSGYLNVAVKACDSKSTMTPKIRTKLYGIVALYKQYRITTSAPEQRDYLSGSEDSAIKAEPLQISVDAGAHVLYDEDARDVYLHMDTTGEGDDTYSLVFTLNCNTINGKTSTFGKLVGYQITVSPNAAAEDQVTVNYPEDYISFLQSADRVTVNGGADYSAEAVKQEIDLINSSMDTVTLDRYFEEWIESVQKTVCSDSALGYDQQLNFKPLVEYEDVQVTVTAPVYQDTPDETMGHFNWSKLDLTTLSSSATERNLVNTFHAGDCLDLSATAGDGWKVIGYEYSVNGGEFDSVKSRTSLVLESGNDYVIRPLVEKDINYIEVVFSGDTAEDNLTLANSLIPNSELPANLKGKNILNLNPDAKTVQEKMQPEVGTAYCVKVLSNTGSSYRPVFRDPKTSTEYQTQGFYLIAGQGPASNRVVVRAEKVNTSDYQTYTISGTALLAQTSIREDGLGSHNTAAGGYSAFVASGQTKNEISFQTSDVDSNTGSFTLSSVTGKKGDRVPILLDNGIYNAQVVDVVLGDDTAYDAGIVAIKYPNNTPKVVAVNYSYLNHSADKRSNSITVYSDDTLTLTATVSTADRNIGKVVFVIEDTLGDTTEYAADKTGKNLYTINITDMSTLSSGDHIYIYLQDQDGHKVSNQTVETIYPTQDTGLKFIVENELIKPKNYSISASTDIDIPLVGKSAASLDSGKIGLTRTDWANNTGYSLIMNASIVYENKSNGGKNLASGRKALWKFLEDEQAKQDAIAAEEDTLNSLNENRADQIINGEDTAGIDGQIAESEKKLSNLQQKDSTAGIAKPSAFSVGVIFCLDFEFIYNPEKNEYQLAQWAVIAGGTFSFKKTKYTMIGCVPCFLNFTGAVQVDFTYCHSTQNGQDVLSQSTFNNYSGNIRKLLANNANGSGIFNSVASLKAQVGAGIYEVLNARGCVSLGFTGQLIVKGKVDPEQGRWGVILNAAGSIGFDLILTSLDIPIAKISKGWGTLEKSAKVSFLGGMSTVELDEDESSEGEEEYTTRLYDSGNSDMSSFGSYAALTAQPEEVSRTTLKEDAAERTRAQLLDLGDGRAFLVFIGSADRAQQNDACLYYTLRDENGVWSTPVPVEDDGTYDSMPTIIRCQDSEAGEDSVVIAWMDANRVYEETDDFRTQYSAFGISAAAYDLNTGTMSSAEALIDDEMYVSNPILSCEGTDILCAYLSQDVSNAESAQDLMDYNSIAATDFYATFSLEELRNQVEPATGMFWTSGISENSIVTAYDREMVSVNDDCYMLSAFTTMSGDGESSDEEEEVEQKLYLSICTSSKYGLLNNYYPICLSSEGTPTQPQVTDLGDQGVFVTWMTSDGAFHILNASEILEALFQDGVNLGNFDESGWYQLTAAKAGLTGDDDETAAEKYEGSIYQELCSNQFRTASVSLSEDGTVSVSEYQLATDGNDVYVFFVAPNQDWDSTGTDLYGMRYRQVSDSESNTENASDSESWGFTEPVAITHDDYVIDEFSLFVTEDRGVELVSNYFTQTINDEGNVEYSKNQLVNISFEAAGSLSVEEDSLITDDILVPGQTAQLSFDVSNEGLFPAQGFDYSVTMKRADNTTVELASGSEDAVLDSGETRTFYASWTVPENIDGAELELQVTEKDTTIVHDTTASITLDGKANVTITQMESSIADGVLTVTAQLRNDGNEKSEQQNLKLSVTDDDLEAGSVAVPALDPGESTTKVLKLPLDASWFDSFGRISMELNLVISDSTMDTYGDILAVSEPVAATFENNLTELSLNEGESQTATAAATPWSGLAGEVVYTSSDPEVASVDQKTGTITGNASGTATITASFPEQGLTATLKVQVGTTPAFEDVTDSTAYYYKAVNWAAEKHIAYGVDTTHFAPSGNTTRAEMITFLWRAAGRPEAADTDCSFTDVDPNAYYYKAVLWAVQNGITAGTTKTTFSPNEKVTRAQAVTFMARMAGVKDQAAGYTEPFTDVNDTDYFSNAVAWAYENHVTAGTTSTTFSPNDSCTRAQVVSFLYRYFGK